MAALYVFDPGPDGSIGDVVVDHRGATSPGKLPAAHRPGRADDRRWRRPPTSCCPAPRGSRRTRAYINGQGRLQAAARAIAPPGEAQEDWQIFVNVGLALGAPLTYTISADDPRRRSRRRCPGNRRYAGLATLAFARPVSAQHWLQASNPSERWKWDFMFQDLPPVKFAGTPRATSAQQLRIPLQKVD